MSSNDLEINLNPENLPLTNNELHLVSHAKKLQKSNIPNSIKSNNISSKTQTNLHSRCEILADQNSNSNSDESSGSTTSVDSAEDQRTMDAAGTLLSIANTPTNEFPSTFLVSANCSSETISPTSPKNNSSNFETSVNSISLEELIAASAIESETSELEKKQFNSAVQLILERASKKLGVGKLPTSITIKTSNDSTNSNNRSDNKNEDISKAVTISEHNNSKESSVHSNKSDPKYEKPELKQQSQNLNTLIESFAKKASPIGLSAVPQLNSNPTLVSPSTSSSSFMFLSTGQVKKQKKFRLDAAEFKQIETENSLHVNKSFENNQFIKTIKPEPVQISHSNYAKISHSRDDKNVSLDLHIAKTSPLPSKNSIRPNKSDYDSDSCSEESSSIYDREPKSKKQRSDSNSNNSSSTNLNDNINMYSVRPAPTLATGRRSKDVSLPPEETKKRQERRDRNKEAAARCRRKREDLTTNLSKQSDILSLEQDTLKRKHQELLSEKHRLEKLLQSHEKVCPHSSAKSISKNNNNYNTESVNNQNQLQNQPNNQQLIRIKKEDIDDIKKISSEKIQQKLTINTNGNPSNYIPVQQTQGGSNSSPNSNIFSSSSQEKASGVLRSPVDNTSNRQTSQPTKHQPNANQIELFQQMMSNFDQQTSKLLTPNSANSINNTEAFSFNPSNSSSTSSLNSSSRNNQLKRPGNLELNKPTSNLLLSSPLSNNELAKKLKEQNNNTAALYQFLNQVPNNSLINAANNQINNRSYNQNRNNNGNIILTPTFSLNTPILNCGPLSFALTPLFDHPLTPTVLQQHLANTPIEKMNDQNTNGNGV